MEDSFLVKRIVRGRSFRESQILDKVGRNPAGKETQSAESELYDMKRKTYSIDTSNLLRIHAETGSCPIVNVGHPLMMGILIHEF